MWGDEVDFGTLVGKTLKSVVVNSDRDRIDFETVDGESYTMLHHQDCCESVSIEDIIGDLDDLVGSPVLQAEATSNEGTTGEWGDSSTWTFYKLATIKGSVTIRWYGTSNGYYSERVSFEKAA